MNIEIERKFIINDWWDRASSVKKAKKTKQITQFYLSVEGEAVTRVRIINNRFAQICIKSEGLYEREEFEYEIPVDDARRLNSYAIYHTVKKLRHYMNHEGHLFEIDEFLTHNAGLCIAEVELDAVDEKVIVPDWFGEDVTGQERYYNVNMSKTPYSLWEK